MPLADSFRPETVIYVVVQGTYIGSVSIKELTNWSYWASSSSGPCSICVHFSCYRWVFLKCAGEEGILWVSVHCCFSLQQSLTGQGKSLAFVSSHSQILLAPYGSVCDMPVGWHSWVNSAFTVNLCRAASHITTSVFLLIPTSADALFFLYLFDKNKPSLTLGLISWHNHR